MPSRPRIYEVIDSSAMVLSEPRENAEPETQLLYGDAFEVREDRGRWLYGATVLGGDTGYVLAKSLIPSHSDHTHYVSERWALLRHAYGFKSRPLKTLPMNARVEIVERKGNYLKTKHGLWVFARHLARLDRKLGDYVSVAEKFEGDPYAWGEMGGEAGLDCSGLVRASLRRFGVHVPHSANEQRERLGRGLPIDEGLPELERGDLIFWHRHVAIMLDPTWLIHATADHMMTIREPLAEVIARRNGKKKGEKKDPILAVNRL
ncbi:MAG TPA: NlpC/P60 family protein [Candidatus Paceibacterota bacterium]|nr:NlpC/P60 family protein [Candidatus Paceibacterota bacterium]